MSQAGILDVDNSNPQIPTQFDTDDDSAIPIANVLEILGGAGIQTSGSGNTVTVSLVGGEAITNITVDAYTAPGTDPVVPSAGNITITGAQVASGVVGTNVIRTDSLAANTVTIEIQRSTAVAATDITKNGVSHFDSSSFSVDGNGFVSLKGGGQAIDSFITDLNSPVEPDASGNVAFTGSTNIFSNGSVANTMRLELQGTNGALFVGRGTNTASASLSTGSSGQLLQSAGATDPAWTTATYPSTATGTGTILRANGTNWLATTSTYPDTNAISTLLYASSANVMGALATANNGVLVTSNTGVPSILAGPGTTGNILQSNAAAAPSFSTATYPSTTTINEILYSSAANTVTGLATANRGVLTTGATGVPVITALATDGQLIIGSTAGAPAAATLTAGTGVSITNGSNSITIAVTGGGFTWADASGAFSPAAQNGYFITGTATGTLPSSPANGDTIKFFVDHASQVLTIQAANSKIIRFGSTVSAANGTAVSTAQGDSVELVYRSTNGCWCAVAGFSGVWNVV